MELMDLIVYGGILVAIIGRGVAMNNRKKKRQQEYLDRQNQQNQQNQGSASSTPTHKESSKMEELRKRLERLDQDQSLTLEQKRQVQLQKQRMEQQKQQTLLQKRQLEQQKQQALLQNQQAGQQRLQQQKLQIQQNQQALGNRREITTNQAVNDQEATLGGNISLRSRRELARAIVMSEILGKPKALRQGRL